MQEIFRLIRGFGGSAIQATQDLSGCFSSDGGKFGKEILNLSSFKIVLHLEEDEAFTVQKHLRLTLKGAMAHPFDGIETRHPLGSTRVAKIVGKYAGGVFCRLYDGVTTILCSYLSMQYDGDFREGDIVEVIINRYNTENKQVYGKILRKIGDQ